MISNLNCKGILLNLVHCKLRVMTRGVERKIEMDGMTNRN
eukprot:SAG11_NODE_2769_length_2993_cov_3.920180_1_plen_40_part_00